MNEHKQKFTGTFSLKLVCIWSDDRKVFPSHTHWFVSKDLSLLFIAARAYNHTNPVLNYGLTHCDCVNMEIEYVELDVFKLNAPLKVYGITNIFNVTKLGRGTEFTREDTSLILHRYGWNDYYRQPNFGMYI